MSQPEVWLVIPWSPSNQGGVTGVVQNLISHWGAEIPARPRLVVNDWTSRTPIEKSDALYTRLQVLVTGSAGGLIKSLIHAPLALWRVWRTLRRFKVVAVNFHYTDHAPFGIALLKRLGLYRGRLVISFHGTDVRATHRRIEAWLFAYSYRHADALVACSNSLADRMTVTLGIDRSRVDVVLNGANATVFRPDAPMTPRLQAILPKEYVASVGAYIARKAHADLLTAFADLADEFPGLHLCLAGADGDELPSLKAQAESLNISPRVHFFCGLKREDVASLLARAKMCVQPALAESMPLAVLEAGAVGVPLAVSDIPGHDELIFLGSTGYRFAPGDPMDCARVMRAALRDAEGSIRMGLTFRERVLMELTWERSVQRYCRKYGLHTEASEQ